MRRICASRWSPSSRGVPRRLTGEWGTRAPSPKGEAGTYAGKRAALEAAAVVVADTPHAVAGLLTETLRVMIG